MTMSLKALLKWGSRVLLNVPGSEHPCWRFREFFRAAEIDLLALPRAEIWRCRLRFTAIRLIKDEHRLMAAVLG